MIPAPERLPATAPSAITLATRVAGTMSAVMPKMLVHSPWIAAMLIGLGLFAHQGFSTNIFAMTTDIVPAIRVASVIALGAVAGNLSGAGIIEFAGWSLKHGHGYAPMFLICGSAYLAALAFLQVMLPKLEMADSVE